MKVGDGKWSGAFWEWPANIPLFIRVLILSLPQKLPVCFRSLIRTNFKTQKFLLLFLFKIKINKGIFACGRGWEGRLTIFHALSPSTWDSKETMSNLKSFPCSERGTGTPGMRPWRHHSGWSLPSPCSTAHSILKGKKGHRVVVCVQFPKMPHSICHPPPSLTLHSCSAPSPLITPACVCVGPWSPDEMDNTVCRLLGNCHDADSRLFCRKCKTNVFIDKKISVEVEQRLKMGYCETECLRSWLESILKPMLRSLDFIKEGNDIVRFCFVLFTWTAL